MVAEQHRIVELQQRMDRDIEAARLGSQPFEASTANELEVGSVTQVVQSLFYGLTVLAAGPNIGKSAFAVDALMSVAGGIPFFGRKVRPGPVVYVGAEAPHSIVQRAKATLRVKFPDKRLPFYIVRDIPRLGNEQSSDTDLGRLVATAQSVASLEGEAIRLIALDTVAMALAGGDENGEGMLRLVSAVQSLVKQTNACVLLLHHPSKADPEGLRGHSSLAGAADVIINIERDALSNIRTAKVVKSRDAPAGDAIHFTLEAVTQPESDQFGDPVTTVIVRAADGAPAKAIKAQGGNQQKALIALREWSRTSNGASLIASDELGRLFKAHGFSRQRRPEILDFLARAGILTASVGGYTVNFEVLS